MNKKSDGGCHRHTGWMNTAQNLLMSGGGTLVFRAEALTFPPSYCTELAKGEILRFDEFSTLKDLHVLSGTVWLTESPAEADHVLSGGNKFTFSNRWPVVVEALSMTKVMAQS